MNLLVVFIIIGLTACSSPDRKAVSVDSEAPIYPDYKDVLFPVNIAAPNFIIEDDGEKYYVKIYSLSADTIRISSKSNAIKIPLKKWADLLRKNPASPMFFEVFSLQNNTWRKYKTIHNSIAADSIDTYLAYRLVAPGDGVFGHLGIYERNLSDYTERLVIDNSRNGLQCLNCHTFNQNNSSSMLLHFRNDNAGLLKLQGDSIIKFNNSQSEDFALKLVYPSWHPSENFIVFSTNQMNTHCHIDRTSRVIDAFDTLSDIVLYDVRENTVMHFPELTTANQQETFPCWSPDGRTLYFCRADDVEVRENEGAIERMQRVKYDLYKCHFDEENLTFSEPEAVIEASRYNRSISLPRISNDGRFLMYCESYGNTFPAWQRSSELRLLDLQTLEIDSLNVLNSKESESFHSWSSDSRWFVFSSKKQDGNYVQLYMARIDEDGKASKPFVLPQASGAFYKTYMRSYNLPELVKTPIPGDVYSFSEPGSRKAIPTKHLFIGESEQYKHIPKVNKTNNTKQEMNFN